jgi:MFS transporter, ACS family, glucarate transporter
MKMKQTNFRWCLAVLMFLIGFISYMDRVNLSVATPAIMGEFAFTKIDMGFMQTAFFVGYSAMQIPGGIMAELLGHRIVVTASVAWWSLFTVLTAATSSFTSFAVVRCLFGLGEGPVYPAMANCIYRWFHRAEKGFASSFMLSGAFIGPVFGPAITVFLMLAFGWRSVFVIFGAVGALMAFAWYFLAAPSPRDSRFVNATELAHIEEEGDLGEQKKELAPWRNFMTSPQFWAIGIQYFITDYIMYVFLAWLPLYLMEAQQFSLQKMGIAAAFPWAAICIVTFTAAFISDKLVAAGLPKHKARTWMGASGLACCFIALYLGAMASTPWLNVFWLTISLGSLGLTFSASWAACTDIGGKFAGSVSGWMNFCGNVGGVLAPICTAWVATNYGWQSAIVFTAFTAVIGIAAWFAVKPDTEIAPSNNPLIGEAATESR